MIQIEVYAPAVDRSFEFEINEHATIGVIVEGLMAMVSAQSGRAWAEGETPLLCYQEAGTVLPTQKTAYQCRIRPGSRLLLV